MELVYLWVEEYKNIHNQGFNFSPKFNCNYDPDTKELTIDENDDYIENFFGDNINVTAIVGKNGSGKSSILEYFLLKKESTKYILIWLDAKNELNILNPNKISIQSKTKYDEITNNIMYYDNKKFKMIFSFAEYLTRDNHPKYDDKQGNVILLGKRNNVADFDKKEFEEILQYLKVNCYRDIEQRNTSRNRLKLNGVLYKDLSFGETILISLFINISKRIKSDKLNILFLDEITLPFHPNWEKKIIQLLVEYFKDYNIHFIISSHSPFLLSDIPKQNIIFLDTDEKGKCSVVDGLKEKKQTFGANIHTLLSDSFFMEDGLMGEFAKGKIDKAITLLNQEHLNDEELKYCEQIISIIGEPIVKNQLQRMLDSKRLKKIDEIDAIKSSMEAMQKRLDELEK